MDHPVKLKSQPDPQHCFPDSKYGRGVRPACIPDSALIGKNFHPAIFFCLASVHAVHNTRTEEDGASRRLFLAPFHGSPSKAKANQRRDGLIPHADSHSTGLCRKKGTVLLSTSLAWLAVAVCSWAETFSQLSSISFAQPCIISLPLIFIIKCQWPNEKGISNFV